MYAFSTYTHTLSLFISLSLITSVIQLLYNSNGINSIWLHYAVTWNVQCLKFCTYIRSNGIFTLISWKDRMMGYVLGSNHLTSHIHRTHNRLEMAYLRGLIKCIAMQRLRNWLKMLQDDNSSRVVDHWTSPSSSSSLSSPHICCNILGISFHI